MILTWGTYYSHSWTLHSVINWRGGWCSSQHDHHEWSRCISEGLVGTHRSARQFLWMTASTLVPSTNLERLDRFFIKFIFYEDNVPTRSVVLTMNIIHVQFQAFKVPIKSHKCHAAALGISIHIYNYIYISIYCLFITHVQILLLLWPMWMVN